MLLLGVLDALCPPELMVSGMCTASWHEPAVDTLVLVCTAIAAWGIVIVPAAVAPERRFLVSVLAFACGAAFATSAALDGAVWGPFTVALVSGGGALLVTWRRWGRSVGSQ